MDRNVKEPAPLPGSPVDLPSLLLARDERKKEQANLLRRWRKPVASLTLVSPGSVKDSLERRVLMDHFTACLVEELEASGRVVLESLRRDGLAGPEAFVVVDCPAAELKLAAMRVEDGSCLFDTGEAIGGFPRRASWGRLLDADALALAPSEAPETTADHGDGKESAQTIADTVDILVLRRESFGRLPRECLLCRRPAAECMGERRHSTAQLVAAAEGLLELAMRDIANAAFSAGVAEIAVRALRAEAELSPKPGLVDARHRGAHDDMDCALLLVSAESLRPALRACAAAGFAFGADPARSDPRALLPLLRPIGMAGEKAMFEATGGVNTHKGAMFCLGLLCAAAGLAFSRQGIGLDSANKAFRAEDICLLGGRICGGMVAAELGLASAKEQGIGKDFPPARDGGPEPTGDRKAIGTAGERLFRELGSRGARGQAEDGFPVIRERIVPLLRISRERTALLDALLSSMSALEDSCLLSRGGPDGLAFAREGAAAVLAQGGAASARGLEALHRLDRELCERHLSPGGSADLLAAGLFLCDIELDAQTRSRPQTRSSS